MKSRLTDYWMSHRLFSGLVVNVVAAALRWAAMRSLLNCCLRADLSEQKTFMFSSFCVDFRDVTATQRWKLQHLTLLSVLCKCAVWNKSDRLSLRWRAARRWMGSAAGSPSAGVLLGHAGKTTDGLREGHPGGSGRLRMLSRWAPPLTVEAAAVKRSQEKDKWVWADPICIPSSGQHKAGSWHRGFTPRRQDSNVSLADAFCDSWKMFGQLPRAYFKLSVNELASTRSHALFQLSCKNLFLRTCDHLVTCLSLSQQFKYGFSHGLSDMIYCFDVRNSLGFCSEWTEVLLVSETDCLSFVIITKSIDFCYNLYPNLNNLTCSTNGRAFNRLGDMKTD